MKTSKNLSQKIKEAGFEGESDLMPYKTYADGVLLDVYKKYDIIYDICLKYRHEFFGGSSWLHCKKIFNLVYCRKPQSEIEKIHQRQCVNF